jgi:lipopolysaccharide exporter
MRSGAAWMVAFKMIDRSLGLISTLILVRLLAPADFGIVAMAVSFLVMAELLAAFGFDVALIQRRDISEDYYHSAWTCNLLLGICITLAMLGAAQPIARFYGKPEIEFVVIALAFGSTIVGLENIGTVAFRKDLEFRKEFAFLTGKRLIGFLVVLPLALTLRNYWALVFGMLASKAAGAALSYLVHPFRPRLCFSRARELLAFSKWLLAMNVLVFGKERVTDLVLGRTHGPEAVGLYNVSNELSNLPLTELAAPLNRVLLPGFAHLQTDLPRLQKGCEDLISVLAVLALPAAAAIAAVAPYLVPVVLGSKWLPAVAPMEMLAIGGGIVTLHSAICTVMIAKGRPMTIVLSHLVYVASLFVALWFLVVPYGGLGAAGAALIAAVVSTPAYLQALKVGTGLPMSSFVRAVVRPTIAAAAMFLTVRWCLPEYGADTPTALLALWLLAGLALSVVSYIVYALLLWLAFGRPSGGETLALQQLGEATASLRTSLRWPRRAPKSIADGSPTDFTGR